MVTVVDLDDLGGDDGSDGDVEILTPEVIAEDIVDLKIEYTATSDLAEIDPDGTLADDGNSTYGRIQFTLPEDWGPRGTRVIASADVTERHC